EPPPVLATLFVTAPPLTERVPFPVTKGAASLIAPPLPLPLAAHALAPLPPSARIVPPTAIETELTMAIAPPPPPPDSPIPVSGATPQKFRLPPPPEPPIRGTRNRFPENVPPFASGTFGSDGAPPPGP